MTYKDLEEFIIFLEKNNHLKRISQQISTNLEITEISRRFLNNQGPALLFENVILDNKQKSQYPVLTNLFAHPQRIAFALGLKDPSEFRSLGNLLSFLKNPNPPASLKDAISMAPLAKRILAMRPKIINKKTTHQVEYNPDLTKLPIQKCWPEDVSPLITWPLIVTKERETGKYNLGVYRMQPISKNKLIIRWLKMRGAAHHHNTWKKQQKPMPAAAIIGANPILTLVATMPIPNNISEYSFAGLIQGKAIELIKCNTVDLAIPLHSEIVIEGEISHEEYLPEGPFGDHTGYYNNVETFPVFNITALTMKKNPIYLSTYTGKPPDEPSIIGAALNEIFIPLIQQQFSEIIDFWLPPEGCSYRIAVISIKKTYAGQAKRVMFGLWSFLQQFMYTKYIIVVDDDINIRDWKEVVWAISTRTDPSRDSIIIKNTPIDYLDFASSNQGLGGKMGIDATNKIPPETTRKWGKKIEMSPEVIDKIDKILEK